MFSTVLVANRGEIAVRVIRTLRVLGVRSVAVFTRVDADSAHVAVADVAVQVTDYLSIPEMLDAVARSGAQAVHPGYGFLSENAGLAAACEAAGVVFVGPPVAAIEAMGDKIRARAIAAEAGVPVLPGSVGAGLTDAELVAQAAEIGYPLLVKPSAGGGGKGMRVADEPAELPDALAAARREARGAFGDDDLLLERYVQRARHIEVQVLADAHGTVLHLGERECSLQRRQQKLVEEAPSPFALLTPTQRQQLGTDAVRLARAVGYTGAGTVEFIVSADDPEQFFFLETNARLQVEHTVTEMVAGLDLVELQLRVAAGEPLSLRQGDLAVHGHAVQTRLYAEDPTRGFLPTGGRVLAVHEPALPHVRVDSGLRAGVTIGPDYDPLLAKIIAWGATRAEALQRLDAALADTAVLGVTTNTGFLRALLAHPDVAAARLDTGLVERNLAELAAAAPVPEHAVVAATLAELLTAEPAEPAADLWELPGGWRLGEPAWTRWPWADAPEVMTRGRVGAADVAVDGQPGEPAAAHQLAPNRLAVTWRGVQRKYWYAADGSTTWVSCVDGTWALRLLPRYASAADDAAASAGSGTLTSPMPGTVLAVKVALGDQVRAGQPLLVVEAMKMEHVIIAPHDGAITALTVHSGQTVAIDAPLVTVQPPSAG